MTEKERTGIESDRLKEIVCARCGKVLEVAHLPSFSDIKCPDCGTLQKIPARFGSFLLLERLGAGGMGVIYHAMDSELGRHVALKVMKKSLGENPEFVKSFKHEAQAAAALNHRNVVQIYSFGAVQDQAYIVMELVGGGRLDEMIAGNVQMEETRALDMHLEIVDGLRAASDVGLVHSDIKPANILFGQHGEAKVVDFGLASFIGQQHQDGQIWGTPYYIAPEKVRGKRVDFRSDIYSLGATLFHVLSGQPPFDGATPTEVVLARLNQPAPSLREFRKDLHPETVELVARMLEAEPVNRYPSYPALMIDMKAARDASILPLPVVKKSWAQSMREDDRPIVRKGVWKFSLALIIVSALVGGGMYLKHQRDIINNGRAQEAERLRHISDLKDRSEKAWTEIEKLSKQVSDSTANLAPDEQKSLSVGPLVFAATSRVDQAVSTMDQLEKQAEKPDEIPDFKKSVAEVRQKARKFGAGVSEATSQVDRVLAAVSDVKNQLELSTEAVAGARKHREEMTTVAANLEDFRSVALHLEKYRQDMTMITSVVVSKMADVRTRLKDAIRNQERVERDSKAIQEAADRAKKAFEAYQKDAVERVEREAKQARELETKIQRELDLIDETRAKSVAFLKLAKYDTALATMEKIKTDVTTEASKAYYTSVAEGYAAIVKLKKFVVNAIRNSRCKDCWNGYDVVDASASELTYALGGAGSATVKWESVFPPQLDRIVEFYVAPSGAVPDAERNELMAALVFLYCEYGYNLDDVKTKATKISSLYPGAEQAILRLIPNVME